MEEEERYIDQLKKEKDIFLKAKLLIFLKKEKNWRIIDLSQRLNVKPSYICHLIRLNKLPEMVIDGYYNKIISKSHLFVLSRLKSLEEIIKVYELILEKNLNITQTEEIIRQILYQTKNEGDYLSLQERNDLINKINSLGEDVKVKITQTRVKSKLMIEIKGSLKKTSEFLRKIKRLIETDKDLIK